ncbi:MAG: DUF4173 domain-containing protein [Candidatus Uhrbacteria bacterium]|nr:DUF4173 domain-containing protein [Candidatus Uhrbacteria bacterium]
MESIRKIPKFGWLALAALLLGIASNYLFFEHDIGINYPVFVALVIASVAFLHALYEKKLRTEGYVLLSLSLFFAAMVFVRSNELLTVFNVLGSVLLLFLVAYAHGEKSITNYCIGNYIAAIFLPLRFISPFIANLHRLFRFRSAEGEKERDQQIVRGLIMAALATLVFTLLFSSADLVFQKYVERVFAFDSELLARGMQVLIVGAFFFGAFCFFFIEAAKSATAVTLKRSLGVIESSILLGALNILFFLFILIQFTYLFGGEEHLRAQGLTYADYATRGFFELSMVAILSFLILFGVEKFIKKEDIHSPLFRWFGTTLVVQVILILTSAFGRLLLYENAYGFTTIRLFSYAFMIWLAVVLGLLAYHINKGENEEKFAMRAFMAVVVLLFSMNMLNPDAFIARKNIERYYETGKLDEIYLASLSDDAVSQTVVLFEENTEIGKSYASYVYHERNAPNADWQSSHFSARKANNILSGWTNYLNENKDAALPYQNNADPDNSSTPAMVQ